MFHRQLTTCWATCFTWNIILYLLLFYTKCFTWNIFPLRNTIPNHHHYSNPYMVHRPYPDTTLLNHPEHTLSSHTSSERCHTRCAALLRCIRHSWIETQSPPRRSSAWRQSPAFCISPAPRSPQSPDIPGKQKVPSTDGNRDSHTRPQSLHAPPRQKCIFPPPGPSTASDTSLHWHAIPSPCRISSISSFSRFLIRQISSL